MTSPIRSGPEYDRLKKRRKMEINTELSKLTNEADRFDRTNISKNRSKEDMQDSLMTAAGLDDVLSGKLLDERVNKLQSWKEDFESTPLNADGTRTRKPLPEFSERNETSRYAPPDSTPEGAGGRSEVNPDRPAPYKP